MGTSIAEMGAKIVELTSNQATTQAGLQALGAKIVELTGNQATTQVALQALIT
jgi:hypothetical protein